MLFSHSPSSIFPPDPNISLSLLHPLHSSPHFRPLFSTCGHCELHHTPKSSGWLTHGLQLFSFLPLFGHFPQANPCSLAELPPDMQTDTRIHTCLHTHILLLLLINLWMRRPLQFLSNSSEGHIRQPPPPLFCSVPRDEMDNCGLFQIVFLTQAGRSIRTTEKAKSSWEQLFTPSLCSFVPPLPSAAFGSESALVLLAVTMCQGANRFLLTGASGGQVWVFHYFLYQVGIIWVRTGLSASVLVQGCAWIQGLCFY